MIEITREQFGKLYKQQKLGLQLLSKISTVVMVVSFILMFIGKRFLERESYLVLLVILILIDLLLMASVAVFRKKTIPKSSTYESVQEMMRLLNADLCSDRTVDMFIFKIGQAKEYEERATLVSLLACVYSMRGQHGDAVNIMKTIDRSRFMEYPRTGMSFYGDLIDIYTMIGDSESVLAAYKDGEEFIAKCCGANYINCMTAVSIIAAVNMASGNYDKALEYWLMRSEYEDDFNKSFSNAMKLPAVTRFNLGDRCMTTAKIYIGLGDYENAAKYADMGGPLIAVTPYLTDYANGISAQIREKINR
ncbi:MAG: hypothetical protein ACI4JJ_00525 [Huintestinicola sp.]